MTMTIASAAEVLARTNSDHLRFYLLITQGKTHHAKTVLLERMVNTLSDFTEGDPLPNSGVWAACEHLNDSHGPAVMAALETAANNEIDRMVALKES